VLRVRFEYVRACSSGVEHLPFKQRVGGSSPPTLTYFCPDGGTGRHTILRGWRPKGHASSSLAPGTDKKSGRIAAPLVYLPVRSNLLD
jgi:hypothetical protein